VAGDWTDRSVGDLFDVLGVPRGGVLYTQSSIDWIERAGFTLPDVLTTLRTWAGPTGTLVMPAYPCRTTHAEYLRGCPTYDVRRTPAAVGLLAEVFRRTPGSVRSLDPDFCVAAVGPDAVAIARPLSDDPDPFGEHSPYQRMLNMDATLLGLGVSLNTNSFMHVIDSRLQSGYDRPVYLPDLWPATVIDDEGESRSVLRAALAEEFQTRTQPSAVAEAIGDATRIFASTSIGGALFFRWTLRGWAEWCLAHGRERLAAGDRPCWLRGQS
jgi:aminoglycoside N3'-acetyltransferase